MKANTLTKKMVKGLALGTAMATIISMAGCGKSTTAETDTTTEVEEVAEVTGEEEYVEYEEEEAVEETSGPSAEILSASLADYKIQIGDEVGVNGEMTVSVLFDMGCTLHHYGVSADVTEDFIVYSGESSSAVKAHFAGVRESDEVNYAEIAYENTSESSASLKDCTLTIEEVHYDTEDGFDPGIYFTGGIGAGSTISDVEAAWGEPYSQDEGSTLTYTYYVVGIEESTRIQVSFDRNTSTVSEISMLTEETQFTALKMGCFPYVVSLYDDEGEEDLLEMGRTYLFGIFFDDTDTLNEDINPCFVQYYNGEISEKEYLAAVVPILEETDYYECIAEYISGSKSSLGIYDAYDHGGSWGEILEIVLKGDLSDEIYEARYSPLESMDPRLNDEFYEDYWDDLE